MKNLILVLITMIAFTGCSENVVGDDPDNNRGSYESDILYQDVRKIIITGLSAVSPHLGEDIAVEIGYYPVGASSKWTEQLIKSYTESGEYTFPDGIDIYCLRLVPALNPPEYKIPNTFAGNVLTINVQKIIGRGFEVQKLIINGLPAVTSLGENIQVEISYLPVGETLPSSEEVLKTYTQSGEYLFPEGINIQSIRCLPETVINEYDFLWPDTEGHVFAITVTHN